MATVQRRVLGFLKSKGSFQFAPRCLSATADGVTTAKDHGRHKLSEVKGFSKIVMSTPPDVSLAHSVSADFQMSRGIAKEFKKKYGSVDELKEQGRSVGEVAVLKRDEGSFVYYLVTRERWWDPATPSAMRFSLLHLKKHCVENGVTKLAMPRLGSGEDRLDWPFVKEIIEDVFRDSDISITAYTTR